jgi:hypothetical protein
MKTLSSPRRLPLRALEGERAGAQGRGAGGLAQGARAAGAAGRGRQAPGGVTRGGPGAAEPRARRRRPCACATAVEGRKHGLTSWGQELSPCVRRGGGVRRKTAETDWGRQRGLMTAA